ncbi:MAG: 7-cyano-7-deazaguanine synthase [Alphaproteobacteria bacterium]|nr:7-cyano-7-deazaguanine synthase [Alphaproteobacteria bacterium]
MRVLTDAHIGREPERASATRIKGRHCVAYLRGVCDHFDRDARAVVQRIEANLDDADWVFANIPLRFGPYGLVVEALHSKRVYLIADPLGMEPIYYCQSNGDWHWSFDIKHLSGRLDPRALDMRGVDEMFSFRWLMEDHTLIDGVTRVLPSHVVCLEKGRAPRIHRYARIDYAPSAAAGDEADAIARTDRALDAYLSRLRGHTSRLGVFLSGGVDSSLLLAKARDHGFDRLLALTGVFPHRPNPELERARAVASHLKVEHRIVPVEDQYIADVFPRLVWQFESPVSYFNNFIRAAMFKSAAGLVDFVLTGEGADGMFSQEVGRTQDALRFDAKRRLVGWLPAPLQAGLSRLLLAFPSQAAARLARIFANDTWRYIRRRGALFDYGKGIDKTHAEDLIASLSRYRREHGEPLYSVYEPANMSISVFCQNRGLYTQNRHQYYCYAVLAREHGIKVGLPYLSSDIFAAALTLQDALKSDERGPKPILKKLARRYIPEDIVYAPKAGFETPDVELLRGPLGKWLPMLTDERTRARNLFDQDVVASLDVARDVYLVFCALGLEIFMRQFLDGDGPDIH